jgi:hypothetical protein
MPERPGGNEFRVFHRLGGYRVSPQRVVDTHKGQHTVRKGLSMLEFRFNVEVL